MENLENKWEKYLKESKEIILFEEINSFDFIVGEKIRSNYDGIPLQIMKSKYPGNYFIIVAYHKIPNFKSCALQYMIQESIKDLCFDCV